MITTELFRADPYRRSCPGRVSSVSGAGVVLDQTCLAPAGSSGYAGDHGWIGPHRIVAVAQGDGRLLVHRIEDSLDDGPVDMSFTVGERVQCELDWPRRYQSMRLHSAQHLVEIAFRWTHDLTAMSTKTVEDDFLVLKPVLASGRIDLEAINSWVAAAVRDDLPMTVSAEPAPPHRWRWHLDGYGHRYCDGLHVRSTGEIGATTVTLHSFDADAVIVALKHGITEA